MDHYIIQSEVMDQLFRIKYVKTTALHNGEGVYIMGRDVPKDSRLLQRME